MSDRNSFQVRDWKDHKHRNSTSDWWSTQVVNSMSEIEKKARYLTSYKNSFQIRDWKNHKQHNSMTDWWTSIVVNSMSKIERKARYLTSYNELQEPIPNPRLKEPQTFVVPKSIISHHIAGPHQTQFLGSRVYNANCWS